MSRIGNKAIAIPAGVTIDVKDGVVTVKGKKDTLTITSLLIQLRSVLKVMLQKY